MEDGRGGAGEQRDGIELGAREGFWASSYHHYRKE
jgi:hypothetical protein